MGRISLDLSLDSRARKLALAAVASLLLALLGLNLAFEFIAGTVTDERMRVSREALKAASARFPDSPRLHARLAEACLAAADCDLAEAESHALRAIRLSPYDYRLPLLMASVKEAMGEPEAVEESLGQALALAPNNSDVHWQRANLLLRLGRLTESLGEFRAASSSIRPLMDSALDIVWAASGGDFGAAEAVAGELPKNRIMLAGFLQRKSRVDEAVSVFRGVDRTALLAAPESSPFIDGLIDSRHYNLARELWLDLRASDRSGRPLLWNGGFEETVARELAQFDWVIKRSDLARFSLDTAEAHAGNRSLRVDFTGRGATSLDGEISQLVAVRPGARYRLECYAKAERLKAWEGPRLVVTAKDSPEWIAASEPLRADSGVWQLMAVDFVAPQKDKDSDESAIYVSIKLRPGPDGEGATEGRIWFDDFLMRQQ